MKDIIERHKIWSVNFQTVQHRSYGKITEAMTDINLKQLEQAKVELTPTKSFLLETAFERLRQWN